MTAGGIFQRARTSTTGCSMVASSTAITSGFMIPAPTKSTQPTRTVAMMPSRMGRERAGLAMPPLIMPVPLRARQSRTPVRGGRPAGLGSDRPSRRTTAENMPETDLAQQQQKIQTLCLLFIAFLAVSVGMLWLRQVMVPFALALFLAAALNPLIDLQIHRLHFKRSLAVFGAFVLTVALIVLVVSLISTAVQQISANSGLYEARITQLATDVMEKLPLERLGVDEEKLKDPLSLIPFSKAGGIAVTVVEGLGSLLSNGVLVLIFVLFLILGKSADAPPATGAVKEASEKIQRYLITKLFVSATTGILTGVTLAILGVEPAFLFGFFAFILNFIPNIGSAISVLLPLPIVLVDPSISGTTAILALAIPAAIQFGIGNGIEPKLMGQSLGLHPVTVLLALIYWGVLWGFIGMLLSVPITAVMKIIFERSPVTLPFARLMEGKLPGTAGAAETPGPEWT